MLVQHLFGGFLILTYMTTSTSYQNVLDLTVKEFVETKVKLLFVIRDTP